MKWYETSRARYHYPDATESYHGHTVRQGQIIILVYMYSSTKPMTWFQDGLWCASYRRLYSTLRQNSNSARVQHKGISESLTLTLTLVCCPLSERLNPILTKHTSHIYLWMKHTCMHIFERKIFRTATYLSKRNKHVQFLDVTELYIVYNFWT